MNPALKALTLVIRGEPVCSIWVDKGKEPNFDLVLSKKKMYLYTYIYIYICMYVFLFLKVASPTQLTQIKGKGKFGFPYSTTIPTPSTDYKPPLVQLQKLSTVRRGL